MKPIKALVIVITTTLLFSSCGSNSNLINQFTVYGNGTMVELREANYTVVGSVSGVSSDMYILNFGGYKANLVEQAKRDMITKAELNGTSRAIINIGLERHNANYILARKLTVTMTGTVIEFTK